MTICGWGGGLVLGQTDNFSLITSRGERRRTRALMKVGGQRISLRYVDGVASCEARVAGGCAVVI